MAGAAFAGEGVGVGFATESYAASALYTTLASLSGALLRIRRVRYQFQLKIIYMSNALLLLFVIVISAIGKQLVLQGRKRGCLD